MKMGTTVTTLCSNVLGNLASVTAELFSELGFGHFPDFAVHMGQTQREIVRVSDAFPTAGQCPEHSVAAG